MRKEDLDSIREQLAEAGWDAGEFRGEEAVAGGVHAAHRLRFERADVFLKTNRIENAAMLAGEAEALFRLRQTGTVILPRPLLHGVAGEIAWLALRWIDLGPASVEAQSRLGRMVAALHRVEADRHGWPNDNHIGLIAQRNGWCDDWAEFFADRRLAFQLQLAERKFGNEDWVRRGFELVERVPRLLDGHAPVASLLHGDLWSGNMAMRADGMPIVFDPASWYGDRETDIAMSELFGGFSRAFYSAYEQEWPLDDGYLARRPLYQLYHVINHANMFGGGYAQKAAGIIDALLD